MNLHSLLHEFLALFYVFIIYDWSCSHHTQVRCVEPVSDQIVVVGLGRRHISVDACESGSTVQFSTHMFVHRFGMGSMRRSR